MGAKQSSTASVVAAQLCSLLNALTAVASESIVVQRLGDISIFQCFLNYAVVGVVYGGLHLSACRASGAPFFTVQLRQYALLSAVDVHANILIVKAFQYTSVTSVTLLDSASIPAAMAFSYLLLGARYSARHMAGAAVVVAGYAVLVFADGLCRSSAPSTASPAPLLGDLLAVAAATAYGASNVLQERLLREAPTREVLAAFGLIGGLISGAEAALLEARTLRALPWGMPVAGPLAGFAAAMFAVYTLAPRVLAREGSAAFNLHLLTSDLWSALARAVLFGGFGGACAAGLFSTSLLIVAVGLVIHFSAGASTVSTHEDGASTASRLPFYQLTRLPAGRV